MVKYAKNEDQRGHLGPIAKKIIKKTGTKGTMFSVLKFHLFGERDQNVENIEIQYKLRKQFKLNKLKTERNFSIISLNNSISPYKNINNKKSRQD